MTAKSGVKTVVVTQQLTLTHDFGDLGDEFIKILVKGLFEPDSNFCFYDLDDVEDAIVEIDVS